MTMNTIDYKTLALREKALICFSFFWRGLAITIGSIISAAAIGGVLGFIVGVLASVAGLAQAPEMASFARMMGFCTGVAISLYFISLYVHWLLTRRLGSYRLLLVRADAASQEA